jgi:hypothetical protein
MAPSTNAAAVKVMVSFRIGTSPGCEGLRNFEGNARQQQHSHYTPCRAIAQRSRRRFALPARHGAIKSGRGANATCFSGDEASTDRCLRRSCGVAGAILLVRSCWCDLAGAILGDRMPTAMAARENRSFCKQSSQPGQELGKRTRLRSRQSENAIAKAPSFGRSEDTGRPGRNDRRPPARPRPPPLRGTWA